MKDTDSFFVEYTKFREKARAFCDALQTQISHIIVALQDSGAIHEAIVTCRVKTWESLSEKLKGRSIPLGDFSRLNDLIGFRIVTLFNSDADTICGEIENIFTLLKPKDNKKESLMPFEFKYTSVHYDLSIPESWKNMPVFKNSGDYNFELQIRTYGQHIWAAVSHALNYKQGVPLSKKNQRELHSVCAMLDEMDLRLDALRKEQEHLLSQPLKLSELPGILKEAYPDAVASPDEEYAQLLETLLQKNIKTQGDLLSLLNRHAAYLTESEEKGAKSKKTKHYFTRCGYVKVAIRKDDESIE